MTPRIKFALTPPLALALSASLAFAPVNYAPVASAQSYGTTQDQREFTQRELDQILAPVALYPDSLLSQILMAATYPGEVVEAARWSRTGAGSCSHTVTATPRRLSASAHTMPTGPAPTMRMRALRAGMVAIARRCRGRAPPRPSAPCRR